MLIIMLNILDLLLNFVFQKLKMSMIN